MRKAIVVTLIVIVLLLTLLWLLQRKLIYFPSTDRLTAPGGVSEVKLTTADGLTLSAWQFRPSGKDRRLSILVANGNAGDRSMREPLARALAAEGFGVLLFDYRGFGGNPGSPTEEGLALDVRAARDHLKGERVVYFGESLGSAVVTELAVERPPLAMVLRSPFTSLADVAGRHYPFLPVRVMLRDRYPVAEQIAKVNVPVVVVYGTADSVVPSEQSQAVADAAPNGSAVAVRDADHNDAVLLDGAELIAAVVALADRLPA